MDDVRAAHPPTELARVESETRRILAVEPGVRWAYLIGSAARNEAFHDIDVAVMADPGRRGTWLGHLAAALEEALGGIPLDVIDLASASPALRAAVVYEGRLLVDRVPEERKGWEVDTVRRWLDLRPWIERFQHLRREVLREARR